MASDGRPRPVRARARGLRQFTPAVVAGGAVVVFAPSSAPSSGQVQRVQWEGARVRFSGEGFLYHLAASFAASSSLAFAF